MPVGHLRFAAVRRDEFQRNRDGDIAIQLGDGYFFHFPGDHVALEMAKAALSGDDDIVSHAEEESVFYYAAAGVEFGAEFLGVGDGAEGAVVDEVALVGDVGRAVRFRAQFGMAAEFVEEMPLAGPSEWDHLDGQVVKRAQLRRHFGFIDDDDFALAGLRDDFLVEQGATAALDEIELRIDLVGSVDGEIDGGRAFGIDQRKSGGFGGTSHLG